MEPDYSDGEIESLSVAAPNVVGMSVAEADSVLEDFSVRLIGEGTTVVAQSPEAGRKIPANGVVVLYTQTNYEKETAVVPDFTGLTVSQANRLAVSNNLNIRISGSGSTESTVVAYKQDIDIGVEVEAGTVITVSFRTTTGVHD